MSLLGSINASKSALAVNAAAIQTTSNNVANAATEGYTRQRADVGSTAGNVVAGHSLGNGVELRAIERQIDQALETRLRFGIAEEAAASQKGELLSRLEDVFNELSDNDLSTQLSGFFNSWAELADKPQDVALRDVVVQEGAAAADLLREMDARLAENESQANTSLEQDVAAANRLADQIAEFNVRISQAENGGRTPVNALRDQRDQSVRDLARLADVRIAEQDNGQTDIYVAGSLLVAGGESRGLTLRAPRETDFQAAPDLVRDQPVVAIGDDQARVDLRAGRLGGTLGAREEVAVARDGLRELAGNLIFELNKLHAAGQGTVGRTRFPANVQVTDATLPLDAEGNGLDFLPKNGSFVVNVTDGGTGLTSQTLVSVDLDGIGTDTTLLDLRADLDAIDGIGATIEAGRLVVTTDGPGNTINFDDDTSNVLASLGVNGFFTGSGAEDIRIDPALAADPRLLAAAGNTQPGDNQTALAISNLETKVLDGGLTFTQQHDRLVVGVTGAAADARTAREAATGVRQTLEAQRDALSGVSLDEEAADLLRYQRAYQAAARLIAAVDEMLLTIMNLV